MAVLGAREDQQVLAVAAHHGGHVVELEEGGERLGVLLALLQALDDGELTLDQAEGAQREVDEGRADAWAQPVEAGGDLGGVRLQHGALGVEPVPAAAQLALVASRGLRRGRPRSAPGVQGVDGPYDLGELVVAAGEDDRLLRLGRRPARRAAPIRSTASGRVSVRAMAVAIPRRAA